MNYYVYVLYSLEDKNLYVGCASNLKERLDRHKNGLVPATKHRRPLELTHEELFEDKAEAFQRERFLKSLWGSREKRKIKDNYIKRKV